MNTLAHINEAMVYSFCGKFELAKAIVEPRWAFGFLCIYLIAIGDSFRSALYHNKLSHLARLQKTPIPNIRIFHSEIQYLQKKSPIMGIIYSFFFPGLGQLYNHRFGLAFYAIFWWWFYLTFSRMHESFLTYTRSFRTIHFQSSSTLVTFYAFSYGWFNLSFIPNHH